MLVYVWMCMCGLYACITKFINYCGLKLFTNLFNKPQLFVNRFI